MNTASRSDRKVQLAFGAAILALLLGGAVSLRTTIIFSESDHWVAHTHEVLENSTTSRPPWRMSKRAAADLC